MGKSDFVAVKLRSSLKGEIVESINWLKQDSACKEFAIFNYPNTYL
jgi:hypothetical protein